MSIKEISLTSIPGLNKSLGADQNDQLPIGNSAFSQLMRMNANVDRNISSRFDSINNGLMPKTKPVSKEFLVSKSKKEEFAHEVTPNTLAQQASEAHNTNITQKAETTNSDKALEANSTQPEPENNVDSQGDELPITLKPLTISALNQTKPSFTVESLTPFSQQAPLLAFGLPLYAQGLLGRFSGTKNADLFLLAGSGTETSGSIQNGTLRESILDSKTLHLQQQLQNSSDQSKQFMGGGSQDFDSQLAQQAQAPRTETTVEQIQLMQSILADFRAQINRRNTNFRIPVRHEQYGDLEVRLDINKGKTISASFLTDSDEMMKLLNQNRNELQKILTGSGLTCNFEDISIIRNKEK